MYTGGMVIMVGWLLCTLVGWLSMQWWDGYNGGMVTMVGWLSIQ